MSQHDYNLANQSGANFRADLNNALGAIATNNSGSSEPSTTFAYEWWVDTSSNVLKIRNSADNAWITLPISVTADNTVDINGGTVNSISSFSFSSGSTVTTILDEDNLASNSATALATQQSIKAYVDSQVTAQDLDISDGSSSISIDLDSESLGLLGGTGLTSSASGNNVTFAIDATVATLTGGQTLTNKTLDIDNNTLSNVEVDNLKSGVLDTDLSSVSGSDDTLASAKAIKTYVDAQVTVQDLDITDGSNTIAIDLDSETLSLLGGTGVSSTASGNGVTFAIGQAVGTGDDVQFNQVTSALVGNASTATALATARAIALSGDVVGTANFDGTAGISISTTIQANSVALGTDTTGNYVATIADAGNTRITVANSGAESAAITLDIADDAITTDQLANNAVVLGTQSSGNYVATIAGTTNEIEVSGSGSETASVTVGLPDDVTIAGNLTVNGTTTTVNTSTLSVEDPLIKLANSNSGADSVDIGFYGLYDTSGAQDLYAGLFRDANDSGKFKLFKDLQTEPTTTVNTSGTGYAVGTLVSNLEGNITSTLTSDLSFADNSKAIFGTGNDLQIFHDGGNSHIKDVGTGDLYISADSISILNAATSEFKASFATDGAVKLYHDNSQRLETTSAGVTIGGVTTTAGLTTSADINFGDNDKAVFGAGSDLEIYHDGSNSIISDTGTGSLKLMSGAGFFVRTPADASMIDAQNGAAVSLYHNNSKKFDTTSTGVDVTGVITTDGLTTSADINFGDSDKAVFGAGSDLQIYHNGTHSYISDNGTGDLYLQGSSAIRLTDPTQSENFAVFNHNGAVNLYHDSSLKFQTTSTGINVIGTVEATNASLPDDGVLSLGTSDELTLKHHNSGYSHLTNTTGTLFIDSDSVTFRDDDGSPTNVLINQSGIDVTGTVTADGLLTANNNTDDTNKEGHFLARQYDSGTETEGFQILQYFSNSSENRIDLGGASSQYNAATSINFYTAANTTTRTGTERARIDSSGNLMIGGTNSRPAEFNHPKGISFRGDIGQIQASTDANTAMLLNRDTSDGTIVEFRKDGTSVGSIGTASGDLTLDVAGDIILDADGGDIRFKDAGTEIGALENSSSDLQIKASVQDKDIIFRGNDGGSGINALTLDMSDAGTAIFNHDVKLGDNGILAIGDGGDLQFTHNNSNGTITNSTGNLLLDVAGDIILDADGGDIKFQDAGTDIFSIINDSSDVKLKTAVQDKSLKFEGNDGGSVFTALTLDMSQAGEADFNSAVKVAGGIVAHQTNRGVLEYASNFFKLRSYGATAGSGSFVIHVGGGGGSADSEALRIDSSRNVGIGTSSPSEKLEVAGKIKTGGQVRAGSYLEGFPSFSFANDTDTGMFSDTDNQLEFSTGGSSRLSIDSSGQVGIGTTSPSSALQVNGAVSITGDGSNATTLTESGSGDFTVDVAGDLTLDADGGDVIISDGGSEKARFSSGKLAIGTSSPVKFLDVGVPTNASAIDANIRLNTHYGTQNTARGGIQMFDGTNVTAQIDTRYDGSKVDMHFGSLFSGGYNTTSRMVITGSGEVGIGTDSPNANLHVLSSGNGEIEVERASGALINLQAQSARGVIGTDSNHELQLKTNGSGRMTIDVNGRVGIGTTSPASNLHIKTSVDNSVAQGLVIERSANTDKGYINYNGGAFQFRSTVGDPIVFGETDSEHLRIAPDGNVGIGDSSPSTKLDVTGVLRLEGTSSTDQGTQLNLYSETGGNGHMVAYQLVFDTGSNNSRSERMRIDSSGKVGIGCSPAFTLDVQDTSDPAQIRLKEDGNTNGLIFKNFNGNEAQLVNADAGPMVFKTNDTERMRIDSSGTLLVDRTSKPNVGEQVAVSREGIAIARGTSSGEYRLMYGNDSASMILYFSSGSNQAQLSAAGAWVDASDVAYKKDIVDINYGLDTVKKLKPRTYKMKPDDEQQIGFVAQELELDIPEIVNGEDGSKGVAYGQLTAVLTKAIQEQQELIEDLQTQINNLRGK